MDLRNLEAPPGFEPGMEVLQSHSAAFRRSFRITDLPKSLGKMESFALTTDTMRTWNSLGTGTKKGQQTGTIKASRKPSALPCSMHTSSKSSRLSWMGRNLGGSTSKKR